MGEKLPRWPPSPWTRIMGRCPSSGRATMGRCLAVNNVRPSRGARARSARTSESTACTALEIPRPAARTPRPSTSQIDGPGMTAGRSDDGSSEASEPGGSSWPDGSTSECPSAEEPTRPDGGLGSPASGRTVSLEDSAMVEFSLRKGGNPRRGVRTERTGVRCSRTRWFRIRLPQSASHRPGHREVIEP